MKKNMVIGITGKTGAGKSTVSEYLSARGAYIIDADAVAHKVMNSDVELKKELALLFGSDIITADGEIDRKSLAKKAFSSRNNTQKLNAAVHPSIIRQIKKEVDLAFESGSEVAVVDAAALFESGGDKMCDFVICVSAPENERLERIVGRDGITQEQALTRIRAQREDEFYESRSDVVVKNYAPYLIEDEMSVAVDKIWGKMNDEVEK